MPTFRPSRARFEAWLLRQIAPAGSRTPRTLAVVALIATLGWIDYVTGTQVSLMLFYLLPIALAVIWMGFGAGAIAGLSCLASRLLGDYAQDAAYLHDPSWIWNAIVLCATYLVFAFGLESLINLHRSLDQRVRARTADLQREIANREQLERELVEISDRERRSIGNDLHDGLGQHLTATAYASQILAHQLETRTDPAARAAHEIVRLAEEGIRQSRQLARGLLLGSIARDSLNRELEELAVATRRTHALTCHCRLQENLRVADDATATQLFRIAQEALRNAIRHSGADELTLGLQSTPRGIVLLVADDGAGLPANPSESGGIGLRVMAHRARLIGAEFEIASDPDLGTRVTCRLPSSPS